MPPATKEAGGAKQSDASWHDPPRLQVQTAEESAIHSICGDIKTMSAEFMVIVKRHELGTTPLGFRLLPKSLSVDRLTEVEFLPALPLKDDELESSDYWIAAPWYCQTDGSFPI